MNDHTILAEIAELSHMTENEMLVQLESDGHSMDELVETVRMLAQIGSE